jgi:hypothetical protein
MDDKILMDRFDSLSREIGEVKDGINRVETRVATAEQRTTAAEHRTIEAMRDMQTEILRGIEAFARGNFARMVRLETADSSTTQRLAAIEERLLMLETRQRPPQ